MTDQAKAAINAAHTSEPWHLAYSESEVYVDQSNGKAICIFQRTEENEENARRIVACVNSCKGIDTEALEQGLVVISSDYNLAKIKRQRDKLLEVAKDALLQIEYMHRKFTETGTGNAIITRLEIAIYNVERTS